MNDLAAKNDGAWMQFLRALDATSSAVVEFDEASLDELADRIPTEEHRALWHLLIRRGRQLGV